MVHKYSDMVLAKLNKIIGELRRLFLVEDLVDSIKVRTTPVRTNWTQKGTRHWLVFKARKSTSFIAV